MRLPANKTRNIASVAILTCTQQIARCLRTAPRPARRNLTRYERGQFRRLEMRSCYRPLYNLHATRRTRRVHDSASLSLSLSLYVSKLAFSFIYTASLEAFRARGRVRITLFDKVARAAWFNETFNCTRAIVLTTGRFTPLLRASRTGK